MVLEKPNGALRFFFTGANAPESVEDLASLVPLAQAALQLKHRVVQDYMEADVVICIDFQGRFRSSLKAAKRAGIYTVLVKQEPPVVFPEHNSSNPHELFNLVVTRGVLGNRGIFNTYQIWEDAFLDAKNRVTRAVAISANKWSADPRELYSLRRRVYSSDPRVDVFGGNWDQGSLRTLSMIAKESAIQIRSGRLPSLRSSKALFKTPLNYKGPAASKSKTLAKYKASVVIENFKGYMSEKLVDSILCGTIPIYVGPNPLEYGIPKGLYVYSDSNVEAIRDGISEALAKNHESYLKLAREWVNTPGVRENWIDTEVSKRIIEFVQLAFHEEIQKDIKGVT